LSHSITKDDEKFKDEVESCRFPVEKFDHRAHLRLAFVYLVINGGTQASIDSMRNALTGLLKKAGIDPSEKYHETITEAWVLAVHHFMCNTDVSVSADDFIDQNPELLDSKIMLTHYSAEVLFSDEARNSFVQPDLEPIPRHSSKSS
jgi:hydrogenase maturation factor HypF (carbamoyltransferase family)